MPFAIRVDQLSKRYRLGPRARYLTLRDTLTAVARAPWRAFARPAASAPVWALRDVSFEVPCGSVLGVIGSNGAGKSTLLKVLARITPPTSGWAEVRGRIGSLLEVGTGFHPELTGRENVFMSGAMLGMRRAEIVRKFDEIVEFAGVSTYVDTPLKQFSSGMAVRLGFAVAAHLDTEILIVDEALAVGDAAFQRRCLDRMRGVARAGRTVLFVTHDLGAVAALTERAICFEAGRIVASGATAEVVREYLARGVAGRDGDRPVQLTERPRPEGISNSGAVQLDWVRTTGRGSLPSGAFAEGEPIAVEFGFTVDRTVADLEFVLGVASLDHGVVVFHDRSPRQARPIAAGSYVVGMRMAPNHLKAGAYSLGLKVFADGTRADTLHDALRFVMIESTVAGPRTGEYLNQNGLLRFDYAWDDITPQVPFDAFSYTEGAPEDLAEEVGSPR